MHLKERWGVGGFSHLSSAFSLSNEWLATAVLLGRVDQGYVGSYVGSLEKAIATHSSTLAWKIPWMEEPCRLQSMGSLRVGHDWATSLSLFTFMHWRRKWQPTPVFLPGESQGQGSLVAAVYGVTQSRTRLKWQQHTSNPAWNQISRCPWGTVAMEVSAQVSAPENLQLRMGLADSLQLAHLVSLQCSLGAMPSLGCSQPREACARRDLELAISAWHETLLKAILFLGSPLAETFFRMACSLRLLSPNPLPSSLLPLEALGLLFPPFFIHSLRHIRFHHGSYSRTLKLALRFIRKPIYSYSLLLGS